MGNDTLSNCKNPCDGTDSLARERLSHGRTKNFIKNNQPLAAQLQPKTVSELMLNYIHATPLVKKPKVHFASGGDYVGQWRDDKICGVGVLKIYSSGGQYIYKGQFEQNKPNNKGKATFPDGSTYEGEWAEGQAYGFGIVNHREGAIYQGYWIGNMQNGQGLEKWPDGSQYDGNFKDGMKHGSGSYTWADGNSYVGSWEHNQISGKGRYQWASGRSYDGEWQQGKMDGFGQHTWEDGKIYEGHYRKDQKHGTGKYIWPDGKVFEGIWANGKRQGKGRISFNGETKVGIWRNDQLVKWIQNEQRQPSSKPNTRLTIDNKRIDKLIKR